MTLKEIVTDDKNRRSRQEIPFTEIEDLVAEGCADKSETEFAITLGFSTNVFYEWRRKGLAPKYILFTLRGFLGAKTHPFSMDDLIALLRCAPTKDLQRKIAKEIGDLP